MWDADTRKLLGTKVTFVDSRSQEHDALVTAVWGNPDESPAINVVFVTTDGTRRDDYGFQIERMTSVVHESNQSAHGNYWK